MPIELLCTHCGKTYLTKAYKGKQPKHYCSAKCRNESQARRVTLCCVFCGTEITDKPSRFRKFASGLVFCSKACHGAHRSHNRTASRFANGIPERVRRIYGNSCVICGFDRVVVYAHVIPVRRGGTIHLSNIVPLCPNHHALYDSEKLLEEEQIVMDDWLITAWGSNLSAKFPETSGEP